MNIRVRFEELLIGALCGSLAGYAIGLPLLLLAGPVLTGWHALLMQTAAGETLFQHLAHALIAAFGIVGAGAGAVMASQQRSEEHIDGVLYIPEFDRAGRALQKIQRADMSDAQRAGKVHGLVIGGVEMSRSAETRHLLDIGLQGGGKTVLIDAVIDQIEPRRNRKMLFDPKEDFVRGRFDPAHAVLLGPWDARSVVWDAASDFRTPGLVSEFCKTLYEVASRPEHKRWVGGAARIVAGLIIAEMLDARRAKKPASWTWATVAAQIKSLRDVDMIKRAAEGDSVIRTLIPSAFSTGTLTKDEVSITNTIPEGVDVIKMLAATDAAKPDALRFSLRRWLSREAHREIDTVIFNFDQNYQSAAGLIFGAMLDVISSTVNSSLPEQSADAPDGLWFLADEAHQLGSEGLLKLQSLAAVARSRGMRILIATQDESQFVAALGRDKAAPLMALAGTRVYAQTSPDVARAICDRAGERKVLQITNTVTGGAVQGKVAVAQTLPAVLASDFTSLRIRREKRWWSPFDPLGAEIIMQCGSTMGRLIQPFAPRRPDIAEPFVPCPAWEWGEHWNLNSTTPAQTPTPTPTQDQGPEPLPPEQVAPAPSIDPPVPGIDIDDFSDLLGGARPTDEPDRE